MGNMKRIGLILLVVGVIVLLLSLVADLFGFGQTAGFGGNQIIGTIVGIVVGVVGLVLMLRK